MEENCTSPGTSILFLLEKLQKQAGYFQHCGDRNVVTGIKTRWLRRNKEQDALDKDMMFATQIVEIAEGVRAFLEEHEQYYKLLFQTSHEESQRRQLPSRRTRSDRVTRGVGKGLPALIQLIKATIPIRRRRTSSTIK